MKRFLSVGLGLAVFTWFCTTGWAQGTLTSKGYRTYSGNDPTVNGEAGFSGEVTDIADQGASYQLTIKYSVFDAYPGAIVSGCIGIDSTRVPGSDFYNGNPPAKPGDTGTVTVTIPKNAIKPGSVVYIFFDWFANTSNYSMYYERDGGRNSARMLGIAGVE